MASTIHHSYTNSSHHLVLILVVDDDTESRIAAIDGTAVSLFGYANETELLNTKLSSIVPPPYREQHRLYAENYLATGIKPLGTKLVSLTIQREIQFVHAVTNIS